MGVIALGASMLILVFLPWLDTSFVRSARNRPLFRQSFWLFVIVCVGLGCLGSKPPEGIYVILARIFIIYYFAFSLFSSCRCFRNLRKDQTVAEFNFGIGTGREGGHGDGVEADSFLTCVSRRQT
jgi:quinol-cytochrome oxidoreductase complex cytochrome b subunit